MSVATSRPCAGITMSHPRPRHWPSDRVWPIVLLACVAGQIGVTLLVPGQQWSMPTGLAIIIFCCGAIVARSTPASATERWRWQLAAVGFGLWGVLFLDFPGHNPITTAIEDHKPTLASLKLLAFIVILVPSHSHEKSIVFRAIDIIQGLLFSFSLALLAWGSVFGIVFLRTDLSYICTGYMTMSALACVSYLSQQKDDNRKLVFELMVLYVGYGLVSFLMDAIGPHYGLGTNSPVFAIGDIIFVVYGIRVSRPTRSSGSIVENRVDEVGSVYRRHLSPILLTTLLLVLAFEIGAQRLVVGMILGVLGLLTHAARTTILLNRYLTARDVLIASEQQHARLLVDMIHEIRAPLGSIVLNASMLQRTTALPDRQAAWVKQICAGSARVTTMLNDVLEIERIDAGLTTADPRACDVLAIVRSAVASVAAQAADAGIALVVADQADPPVMADPDMLERVFVNLLTNAVRFTPGGGRIAVTLDDGVPDMMIVHIGDTGVGIPSARVATLFDRFSHIGTPLRGHRGSGLGLSICQGLMTAMEGKILIHSRPGEGTVAAVHIPRA